MTPPTVRDTARLLELKRKIELLGPSDRLRLAAQCLDDGEFDMAEALVHDIAAALSRERIVRKAK